MDGSDCGIRKDGCMIRAEEAECGWPTTVGQPRQLANSKNRFSTRLRYAPAEKAVPYIVA